MKRNGKGEESSHEGRRDSKGYPFGFDSEQRRVIVSKLPTTVFSSLQFGAHKHSEIQSQDSTYRKVADFTCLAL